MQLMHMEGVGLMNLNFIQVCAVGHTNENSEQTVKMTRVKKKSGPYFTKSD